MNKTYKFLTNSAVAIAIAALLPSCAMEAPFADGAEGNLTLTTVINSEVKQTRALSDEELADLREKCIVYIENNRGVIRKYKGVDNIPASIRLQTGEYVAEAWSGDSVSASFSSKFYRGWQKFEMAEGQNSLTLTCKIANVVVSVDPESLNVDLDNLKVTFSHSRGELEFTDENIATAKGYFMMPNADKDLNYKIEGTKQDGTPFVKEGKIQNVERAHEYCLKVTQNASEVTEGGALIKITIADIPLYETEVEIFSAPVVKGVEYDINKQYVVLDNNFVDRKVYVRGYFGLSSLVMDFSDNFSDNFTDLTSGQNVLNGAVIGNLAAKGIIVERSSSKDAASSLEGGEVDVDEVYVTLTKAFFESLPAGTSEYSIKFTATDNCHKVGEATFRLANNLDAVETLAPVAPAPAPDPETEPMAVGAHTATLTGILQDASATNFGIMYREQGTSEWQRAYPSSANSAAARRAARYANTRAGFVEFKVTIKGLQAGKTYEYKVFCDDYEGDVVNTVTTESYFEIPNSSFEEWSTEKGVILPGNTGDKLTSFWGSGNEAVASVGSFILTNKSTDMVHSGTYSAKLASCNAYIALAAGNIFVGHFKGVVNTSKGQLELGRPFNYSHPTKVRVWANYRPGKVDKIAGTSSQKAFLESQGLVKNSNDHGQIYIALATGPVQVDTSSESTFFNPHREGVIAYGEVTWKENFGPDGQLQMIEIPFEYYNEAQSQRPTHLIITCCASKYGDYYSGSTSSVLYLDDFELVYE